MDLHTGDWIFTGNRDYAGVTGTALIAQRIHTRLVIERGSFIYDRTGELGSHLRSLLSMPVPKGKVLAEGIIREALEPMRDIIVSEIVLQDVTDDPDIPPTSIKAIIFWAPAPDIGGGFIDVATPVTINLNLGVV